MPAATSQAGMMSQPMHMGMFAAPIMMPVLDFSTGSAYYASPFAAFADISNPWFPEAPMWPVHFDQSYYEEGELQQLPLKCVGSPSECSVQYPHVDLMWHADFGQAEIPEQVTMDSTSVQHGSMLQRQRGAAPPASARTLCHRKGQDCSTHALYVMTSDLPNLGDQRSNLADTDTMNAQARQLANSLLVQMQGEENAHAAAVASFERLAFMSKTSSLAAQMILEEASVNDKLALALSLRSHVCSAVQSKHANHVIQKVVEVMTVTQAHFIVDELQGSANEVARHIFGCRVLCRILEHLSPNDLHTIALVEELFIDTEGLVNHVYGSFVVRHLLEFGLPHHKHRVVSALRSDLASYTKHKFGSHVVEAALRHASVEDQQGLARELLQDKEELIAVAANQFGRHVVRALLALPDGLRKEALEVLRPMENQLKASRYAKSVFQAVRAAASA